MSEIRSYVKNLPLHRVATWLAVRFRQCKGNRKCRACPHGHSCRSTFRFLVSVAHCSPASKESPVAKTLLRNETLTSHPRIRQKKNLPGLDDGGVVDAQPFAISPPSESFYRVKGGVLTQVAGVICSPVKCLFANSRNFTIKYCSRNMMPEEEEMPRDVHAPCDENGSSNYSL